MTILDSLVEGALCLGNRRESNELLGMMVRYLVTGEVPEPRTNAQRMAITLIMPVLENSRARAEAGRKGGLSRGSAASGAASKPESKRASKTESKSASEEEEEEEEEEELGVWINPSDCENEGGGGAEFVPPTLEEVDGAAGGDGVPFPAAHARLVAAHERVRHEDPQAGRREAARWSAPPSS